MNRKIGSLRHPSSGPCPLRTSSALSPSATVLDADAAINAYNTLEKYRSTEVGDDLLAQQMERSPIMSAPKLVIRPLAQVVGALDPQYFSQNLEEQDDRQQLHTAEAPRSYGKGAFKRQNVGIPHDHDAEWGPDPEHGHPLTKQLPIILRRAPVHTAAINALPQNLYDTIPYDNIDPPLLPVRSGPPAAAALFQQRIFEMDMCAKTPQLSGHKRPSYGRILLQRLAAPADADVSRIPGYLDTYTLDCRDDSSGHPIEPRPPPYDRQPPYGLFQDVVQRGLFATRHASPNGVGRAAGLAAPSDDVLLRGPVMVRAQAACRDQLYRWTSGIPEDEPVVVQPVAQIEMRDVRVLACEAEAKTPAALLPFPVPKPANSAGGRPDALCNLEALAEVACRAAELLDREEGEDQRVEAEAAELGAMTMNGGHSRRSREAEERSRVDGASRSRRQRGAAAAAATAAPAVAIKRHQQQQAQQQQQQVWTTPLEHPWAAAAAVLGLAAVATPAASPTDSGPSLALPLTVFHLDRKCPKVLAPRSGRLGDTKHLVLPGEIVQSLPEDVCSGDRPILVQALVPPYHIAPTELEDKEPPHQQQQQQQMSMPMQRCDIECQIGNGPGGFPALHLPVSQAVYGRPVRRFTLREDMVLELELGDPVVKPSRGIGGKKRISDESSANTSGEEAEEEEGADGDGTAPGADASGTAAAAASPPEVCSPPLGKDNFVGEKEEVVQKVTNELEATGKALSADAMEVCNPESAGVSLAEPEKAEEGARTGGTGSGSNVSDDTRVVAGSEPLSAAAVAITAAGQVQPEAAMAGTTNSGGGGRRRGAATAILPIVVRRPLSSKPTVMRSCTGAVGSKKHLPLPGSIMKALPHPQRSGAAPVDVVVTFPAPAAAGVAGLAAGIRDTAISEERIRCFVGPTGSHGCAALQVTVSRAMNGRRLLHITLRTDLTIELGLGERVEMLAAATHSKERAAVVAATYDSGGDIDVDFGSTITETADRGELLLAATGTAQRRRGSSGGGGAVWERGDGMAPRPSKRRRSSSVSPCDSAAAGDIATIAAAAATAPPPRPPQVVQDGCGVISEVKTAAPDTDPFKDLAAMAAKAGLTMKAIEVLQLQLLMQQQQQQQQQQQHLHLQPLQHRRPHAGISVNVSGPADAVTALPVRLRSSYPPSGLLSPYGMPSFEQTAVAASQPISFASVETAAPVVRRMRSAAPPRCQRSSDIYGSVHALQSHFHATQSADLEDVGVSSPS
ncbi:hypothetical protein Vretifemale_14885, partial [Volvox reticuliferus]